MSVFPKFSAAFFLLSALQATSAQAADPVDLKVGDAAPVFEVDDDSGKPWKSSEHVGQKIVVVYFYPADLTGGCTKQAGGFRDDLSKLAAQDIEVVGVSGDSVRNHQLFKKAHQLNFALLADVDGKVAETFGVPVTRADRTVKAIVDGQEESLFHNVSAKRWTFVIDKQGKIAAKNTAVVAAEDSKAILDTVAKLKP